MVLAAKDKIRIALSCIIGFFIVTATGCKDEDKLGVVKSVNPDRMPQLSTRNVFTLISDSGYTKYKVVTPLWNVYGGKKEESYWDFPEGVYLRQMDKDLNVISTVAADSACYFPNRKLWELYGDVEIDQKEKAYFYSDRIFFDDRKKRIYSDQFIHIETPDQVLEGIGFESNEDLTVYKVTKPTGIFPRSQFSGERHRPPVDDAIFEGDGFVSSAEMVAPPEEEPPMEVPMTKGSQEEIETLEENEVPAEPMDSIL